MSKNMDRRVRKTRAQLRQGLAELLKEKSLKEITVKELVEKVDINRSTFYLHYADIYDMMEKIENELTGDIEDLIHTHPVSPFNENSFPFIEDIFSILAENRDICAALLGPNGDISFLHRIENILSEPERPEGNISGEDGRSDILLRLLSLRLYRPGQGLAVRWIFRKSPAYGRTYI